MNADKRRQEWWPGHVAKGCLMISLDNEMHMSIVDEIQIRKLTTKCFVSIPILTSFLQQKNKKNNNKKKKIIKVCLARDCPVGGRASSYITKIITQESIYTCAWISAILSSSRTLGPFHLREPRHGKYSTPIIKVVWVQTDSHPGVAWLI